MEYVSDPDEQAHFAEFERHRAKFYEMIGHYVSFYQTIEDYLPDVFEAALGGDAARARAIFATVRGLEAKLDVVSAAMIGAVGDLGTRWAGLVPRVARAAKARNEIAHAKPLHHGGTVTVTFDPETLDAIEVKRTEKGRMELRKQRRGGETVWTVEQMLAEYRCCEVLFRNLIALVQMLRGEAPPPHLLEGL